MLWIEAVKRLSADLPEPYALEFVYRAQHELTKLDWLNRMREEISDGELSALTEIAGQLAENVPPQYIVGWAEFCDLRFKVDARVLIPRPETEELVQLILSENGAEPKRVLDIGTGSGAIAVSLAKRRPGWTVVASDLSAAALNVARENARLNGVTVDFVSSDVLDNVGGQFDIIVSNPPYIDQADVDEVDVSVNAYEPHSALYAEEQGLAIYQKIAAQAPSALTDSGKIYLEIGYKQGETVKALFEAAFPEKKVTVYQDFFGKDRMVSVI